MVRKTGSSLIWVFVWFVTIGFAYNNGTATTSGSSNISKCVCECLLQNGCQGLTYFSTTGSCLLFYDSIVTEDEVSFNSSATLLLVTAQVQ